MTPTLVPSVFRHGDPTTDFSRMILEDAYADALFVFNDNVGAFEAFHRHDPGGCEAGGGNAAIRPHQCTAVPRAAGIPTGPGFDALDDVNRALIDRAVAYIAQVVRDEGYARVIYSASAHDPDRIGTSIFHVGEDVRRYCVTALRRALGASAGAAAVASPGLSPAPQPVTLGGQAHTLVAFYYPGHPTAWDQVYEAGFCGNFWQAPLTLTVGGTTAHFHCGEAAFQSTKWWHDAAIRAQFEQCATGSAAFHLKKGLSNPDPTYAGLHRVGAMAAVLEAKFADPALAAGLLATGSAYLLEHNAKKGLDAFWSDDHDGTGGNRLGELLMARRAALGGAGRPTGTYTVADFTAQVRSAS